MPRDPSEQWTEAFEALFDSLVKRTPGVTQRKAAARAGITESRWRQIVRGQEHKAGQRLPVGGPSGTVAMMARGLGITAEQLREVDHPLAAIALEELDRVDAERRANGIIRDPTRRERLLAIREHVDALLVQCGDE